MHILTKQDTTTGRFMGLKLTLTFPNLLKKDKFKCNTELRKLEFYWHVPSKRPRYSCQRGFKLAGYGASKHVLIRTPRFMSSMRKYSEAEA